MSKGYREIIALCACVFVIGCASNFTVSDKGPGIPVLSMKPMKVTRETSYGPAPGVTDDSTVKRCLDYKVTSQEVEALPVGGSYFLNFEPSDLGKGEFIVKLTAQGSLEQLSINSDAKVAENITAVAELLKAATSAVPAFRLEATPGDFVKFCVKTGTSIVKIDPF